MVHLDRLCVFVHEWIIRFEFDLVVSGINSGANLGDDVLYSGTVGAAFEGRLMKQPRIAVSLAGHNVRVLSASARLYAGRAVGT